MQIAFTFRNADAEDWLKDYVNKKLVKLKKHLGDPVEAHIVLAVEKFRNVAEINLSAKGININGKEEAKDMTAAVDAVIDKIERQIKKHKQKIITSRSEGENLGAISDEEYSEEDQGPHRFVDTAKVVLQPMTVDDAILRMEELKNTFFIYRDSLNENVSVIYRRADGSYALIETNS